jgi:hypothetical protein
MSREYLSIGPAPYEEKCENCGSANYSPDRGRFECKVFANQLRRQFPEVEESGARFGIQSNEHDFGVYYEVVVVYTDEDLDQVAVAYNMEEQCPANWDEIARQELGLVTT